MAHNRCSPWYENTSVLYGNYFPSGEFGQSLEVRFGVREHCCTRWRDYRAISMVMNFENTSHSYGLKLNYGPFNTYYSNFRKVNYFPYLYINPNRKLESKDFNLNSGLGFIITFGNPQKLNLKLQIEAGYTSHFESNFIDIKNLNTAVRLGFALDPRTFKRHRLAKSRTE